MRGERGRDAFGLRSLNTWVDPHRQSSARQVAVAGKAHSVQTDAARETMQIKLWTIASNHAARGLSHPLTIAATLETGAASVICVATLLLCHPHDRQGPQQLFCRAGSITRIARIMNTRCCTR
jgi:hypothetical protein